MWIWVFILFFVSQLKQESMFYEKSQIKFWSFVSIAGYFVYVGVFKKGLGETFVFQSCSQLLSNIIVFQCGSYDKLLDKNYGIFCPQNLFCPQNKSHLQHCPRLGYTHARMAIYTCGFILIKLKLRNKHKSFVNLIMIIIIRYHYWKHVQQTQLTFSYFGVRFCH